MIHVHCGFGMGAPPCGTLSCDLAPNLEGDTVLEGGRSGPSPDIQGQYKMGSRRGSPWTRQYCWTVTSPEALLEFAFDLRMAVELREVDRWEQTWG